jgi:hypothetical protein
MLCWSRQIAKPALSHSADRLSEYHLSTDHLSFAIQVNSNCEQLCSEKTHRSRIPAAPWQMTRQPALALKGIIVGEQMRRTRVPPVPKPVAQSYTYTRIAFDVDDVSRSGVRRGFPLLRPVVSSIAYPGSGRPMASASLIGGLSRYF